MRVTSLTRRRTTRDRTLHPTRLKLLDTVERLLAEYSPEQITADMVLTESGVSKGSLYHHFEDFPDLMTTAMVHQFSRNIDRDLAVTKPLLENATSAEELFAEMDRLTDATQGPDLVEQRLRRARLIVLASQDSRVAAKLAAEQDRLTAALAELFEIAQKRGWFRADFAADVAAVLIQAYTLGKLLDDFSGTPVDPARWSHSIKQFIRSAFSVAG